MIILFQILFVLFSMFAVFAVWKKKEKGLLGPKGVFFWTSFWLLAVVAVVWPESTSILASKFGIGRGVDLVFYFAFVILFYIIFRLHIKIESVGRDITKIVRKNAINSKHSSK
ncbi:MAG: DUF2304 domain-containing protein [Candidatus Magasanikbacteria bacterium]|nr:DUF2304 domain-containing protein [Candidatus Magasanikbacteria bacterium]